MLTVIFGDDEHTAADGPYARVLKTRKWLYIASGALVLFDKNLYKQDQAEELINFISLPQGILAGTTALALAYLLIQYLLLAFQLVATYDIVLRERFVFRRADELAAARDRIVAAQQQLDSVRSAFKARLANTPNLVVDELQKQIESIDLKLGSLQTLIREADNRGDKSDAQSRFRDRNKLISQRSTMREELKSVLQGSISEENSSDPAVQAAAKALNEAEQGFYELRNQIPTSRSGYRSAEVAIDSGRIIVPLAFACWSLVAFLF